MSIVMLGFLFNETLKYINVGQTCHCKVKLHKNARIEHKKTKKLRFWGREKEMMETKKKLEAIVPFILVFDRKLSLFSYRVKKIQIAIVNDHAENLGKKIWV